MIDLLNCENFDEYVEIKKLSDLNKPDSFFIKSIEYSDYIINKALVYQNQSISKTFLLIDKIEKKTIGYISLICDVLSTTDNEKKKSNLTDIPFKSFPAIKIAQLAVAEDEWIINKYQHIGSFLIQFGTVQALEINDKYCACRFITVDADVENTPNVDKFYYYNGFMPLSSEKYKKRTKQIPMYKDIYNI